MKLFLITKVYIFLLKITSYFMLALYSYTLLYRLFISTINDKNCVALSFIYTKHLIDILVSHNYTIMEYELNRGVMWLFTRPLMLKMYCDANDFICVGYKYTLSSYCDWITCICYSIQISTNLFIIYYSIIYTRSILFEIIT